MSFSHKFYFDVDSAVLSDSPSLSAVEINVTYCLDKHGEWDVTIKDKVDTVEKILVATLKNWIAIVYHPLPMMLVRCPDNKGISRDVYQEFKDKNWTNSKKQCPLKFFLQEIRNRQSHMQSRLNYSDFNTAVVDSFQNFIKEPQKVSLRRFIRYLTVKQSKIIKESTHVVLSSSWKNFQSELHNFLTLNSNIFCISFSKLQFGNKGSTLATQAVTFWPTQSKSITHIFNAEEKDETEFNQYVLTKELTRKEVYQRLFGVCLAFYSNHQVFWVPPYVILEIFDWFPTLHSTEKFKNVSVMHLACRVLKVSLIEAIAASVKKISYARQTSVKYLKIL